MDKTAIEALAKMAVVNDAKLEDHNVVLVPKDYELKPLETFESQPDYYRAKFDTSVFSEFIAYVNDHGDHEAKVFIDTQNMIAKAILDMGTIDSPQWGKHRASLGLIKTPAYLALTQAANTVKTQQEFIDFAEDWRDILSFYFGDDTFENKVPFAVHLRNIRNIKVNSTQINEQSVGNYNTSRSALESIEVKAGTDELPAGFTFTTIPYEGFEPVTFDCQLRAVSDDKNVKLKYRISQLDTKSELIAFEFRDKLKDGITDSAIRLFVGTMQYQ